MTPLVTWISLTLVFSIEQFRNEDSQAPHGPFELTIFQQLTIAK